MLSRPDVIISIFNNILHSNKNIKVYTFKPERDFIHIDDVAIAIIKLLKSKFTGSINLGSEKNFRLKKFVYRKITKRKISSENIKVDGPYKYSMIFHF